MRVVHALGWYFPDSLGGTEVYVDGLARRLQAAGHDVTVAAPRAGGRGLEHEEHAGVPVLRYPIPPRPTRAEVQGDGPVRGTELFHGWLREWRPDVVHVHSLVTGLGLAELRAARAAGARVFVTSHTSSLGFLCQRGTLMQRGEQPCDGLSRPMKCAACALQQRGLPQGLADAFARLPPGLSRRLGHLPGRLGTALGMSGLIARNQARQIELANLAECFVLLTAWSLAAVAANGIPRNRLALNRLGAGHPGLQPKPGPVERPTASPIRIGYLGRLERVKGVEFLIQALRLLPAEVPLSVEVRAPLHGEDDRRELERLRGLACGDPRIAFLPALRGEEVPGALASWDLLCCPSVCHEGGPTVAIEAQAVGTPVVGSRIGGLAELVHDGETGRLLPPGDASALAAALREVALEPGRIDRWRLALGPARSADDVARDYLELYAA